MGIFIGLVVCISGTALLSYAMYRIINWILDWMER
jgi:hypothetical protein